MSQLRKKQSLSILSGSHLNQLNGATIVGSDRPLKERVISESTGLIKFALRQSSDKHSPDDEADKQGLPIYIPIEENVKEAHGRTEELNTLMFQLASKQRKALELREELESVESEVRNLELECRKLMDIPEERKLAKKQSIINFAPRTEKLNQEPYTQLTKTLNTFTSNFSSNINANDLLNKGKSFIENLNKENEKWLLDLQNRATSFRNEEHSKLKKLMRQKKAENSPLIPKFRSSLNLFHASEPDNESEFSDDEHYGGETSPYLA
ncbi:hypothetical protein KL918_003569 [Ogataea parapolymorpha]|uniref:Uncharacterized protein n=1 Tax=Ogataea parapolymorpha (strain ATCC 26012 / BCRC 20466 / JCM 22074 / NRRL Y-7560 / DL-1) TaxID=871575 RepID=W1Q6Z3_OGAPD|nr:hypothetical protein HPODL_02651 [Ogataea parapolymorpha DL-1]ESW96008.1 hypothetical protein HPODL_02651 [Ogataea parapolymorpha DL-1]KAG7866672.1 hypothetical protein KL918_003569 [Ogataea parapolymorpha]KAG7870642.1 hypothetical protein KL916_004847 [Ogataea parapolymorpha]